MNIKGFSLIELMVVIAIVALLAAVALPAYRSYITTAEISSIKTVFDIVKKNAVQYYNENGDWPTEVALMGFNDVDNNYYIDDAFPPYVDTDRVTIENWTASGCGKTYALIHIYSDMPDIQDEGVVYSFRSAYGEMSDGRIVSSCEGSADGGTTWNNSYMNGCDYNSLSALETAICL